MSKKIIVPIDFSAASQNAYLYAREIAKIFNKTIEVVHINFGSYDSIDQDDNRKSTPEFLNRLMNDFITIYPKRSEVNTLEKIATKSRVIQGLPIKSIVDISEEKDTFMIIMGSTGQSDAVDRLFGRISSEVAQKAACPVLLVPKGAKFFPIKNILYASNLDSADKSLVEKILDFNTNFTAALHFINISKKQKDRLAYEAVEDEIFDTLFKDGDPKFSFNLATIEYHSVMKGLLNYSDENNIDLIVLVNKHRKIIESTFGQSMTKKLAMRSHKPLLIYHLPQ